MFVFVGYPPDRTAKQADPMVTPDYRSEAEQIVREEREQKERLPQYVVSGSFFLGRRCPFTDGDVAETLTIG
jgi:hypothetical protein